MNPLSLRVHTGLASPDFVGIAGGIVWLIGAGNVLVGVDVASGARRFRTMLLPNGTRWVFGPVLVQLVAQELTGWHLSDGAQQWSTQLEPDEMVVGTLDALLVVASFARLRVLRASDGGVAVACSIEREGMRTWSVRACGADAMLLHEPGDLYTFARATPERMRLLELPTPARSEWRGLVWSRDRAWALRTTEAKRGPTLALVPVDRPEEPINLVLGGGLAWADATAARIVAVVEAPNGAEVVAIDPTNGAHAVERVAGLPALATTEQRAAYALSGAHPELALGYPAPSGMAWTRLSLGRGRVGLPVWHGDRLVVTWDDDLLVVDAATVPAHGPVRISGVPQAVTAGELVEITFAGQSVAVIGKHAVYGRVTFTRAPEQVIATKDRLLVTDHEVKAGQLKVHRWSRENEMVTPPGCELLAEPLGAAIQLAEPRIPLRGVLDRLVARLSAAPALLSSMVERIDRESVLRDRWNRLGFALLDGDPAQLADLGVSILGAEQLELVPFAELGAQIAVFVGPRGAPGQDVAIWWYQDGGDLEWVASSFDAWFRDWLHERAGEVDPASAQLWDDFGLEPGPAGPQVGGRPSWFGAAGE